MTGPSAERTEWVADLSRTRQRLRVGGADRVAFLQGQCTNDVKKLAVGQSCYAAFLNAKGKMRGEGHIICVPDAFLLETSPGLQPSLEKFIITEDVVIEDVSSVLGEWLIVNLWERHSCRDQSGQECPSHNPELPADAIVFAHPLGTGVISATPLVATLSAEELEVLRVEAAVPLWGVDMDENTIPVEAGLEKRAISYDKGCYIGQETIARIKTYGHVNRQLVQLVIHAPLTRPSDTLSPRTARGEGLGEGSLPASGDKVFAGDNPVGNVTSAVLSNRLGKRLALGYVRREFAVTGTKLRINGQDAEVLRIL